MIFSQWILTHEGVLRLTVYAVVLLSMLLLERRFSARPAIFNKPKRWLNNIALSWSSTLFTRFVIPISASGTAAWYAEYNVGLLNIAALPLWLKVIITIVLMDFFIYWQHRAFHTTPLLWRLHAVHHADIEVDASTGNRFHPFEIFLSMLLKIGLIFVLGLPVLGVILFEILLNGSATFNHANIRLHPRLETFLRYWLVTPAVHRFHHSQIRAETDSNFGFFLIIWDKLFGTFLNKTREDENFLQLGLPSTEHLNTQSLGALLLMPLRYPNHSEPTPEKE